MYVIRMLYIASILMRILSRWPDPWTSYTGIKNKLEAGSSLRTFSYVTAAEFVLGLPGGEL